MIKIVKRTGLPGGDKWFIKIDGLCYDVADSEEKAKEIVKRLEIESTIQDLVDGMVEEISKEYKMEEEEVKKLLRGML